MNKKVVVINFEGLSYELLNKWCDAGKLVNFKNLLNEQGGALASLHVPYEGPCIVSAFSGLPPEEHGVFSYFHVHNKDYIPTYWHSNEIPKHFIWNNSKLSSKKTGLINIFGTFPAYEINGYMLSYLFEPTFKGCYPANYIKQLVRKDISYSQDVFAGLGYGKENSDNIKEGYFRENIFKSFKEIEDKRLDIVFDMIKECDVLLGNFTIADRVSHYYWHELVEGSEYNEEETLIYKAYKLVDNLIGRIINKLNKNDEFLIFSEFGFGPLKSFISINKFLKDAKYLSLDPDNQIDWGKTMAYESVQGSHGVNINLFDRYNKGTVHAKNYDKIREDIIDFLITLQNPYTKKKLFNHVTEREKIYKGAYVDNAPDIIFETADENYVPLGDYYWANRIHRNIQTGWHRKQSIWTGYGEMLKSNKKNGTILDIVPTILHLISGNDQSKEYVGNSLLLQ